jgi:type VI secretion system protein VasG
MKILDLPAISLVVSCIALILSVYVVLRTRYSDVDKPEIASQGGDAYPMRLEIEPTNLKQLVNQLDPETRRALEGAAGSTLSQKQWRVEIEHWLLKLIQSRGVEFDKVLVESDVPVDRVIAALGEAIPKFRSGATGPPELSTGVMNLLARSVIVMRASGELEVRPSHVLYALLADKDLADRIKKTSPVVAEISTERLRTAMTNNAGGKDVIRPGPLPR